MQGYECADLHVCKLMQSYTVRLKQASTIHLRLQQSEIIYNFIASDLQRIQVERLMASVVAFVVTVELIALRGKMTDVARRECQRSAWENRNMLFPRQNVVIPA